MKNIKKGDIVTQDINFNSFWKCPKFKLEVTFVEGQIAHLSHNIHILNYDGSTITTSKINFDYIKIDIEETRKQKLIKINERV